MGLGSGGGRLSYAREAYQPSDELLGDGPSNRELGFHATKGKLGFGRSFRDNLHDAMSVVPLNKAGYFGNKSSRGWAGVRIFESSNPAETAYEFASKCTKGYVSMAVLPGKGYIMRMADGVIVTYRYVSGSSDRSPVVQLEITGLDRVKRQKIHFVKRSK